MRETQFYSASDRLRAEALRGRYGACDNEGVDALRPCAAASLGRSSLSRLINECVFSCIAISVTK